MEMIVNRETEKLELHFSREEYMALSESDQAEIKSNFLFSRRAGAWVSSGAIVTAKTKSGKGYRTARQRQYRAIAESL